MKPKKQQVICIYIFLLFISIFPVYSHNNTLDSLKTLLTQTSAPEKRVEICNNIDEYSFNNSKVYTNEYAYQLLYEAIKAKDNYAITKALRKLLMLVNRQERQLSNDSVAKYLQLAENHLTGEWKKCFVTEIRLRHLRSSIDWTKNEKETTIQIMKQYTSSTPNDIYGQIEREYALGKSYGFILSEWGDNLQQSQYHFDNLQHLIEKLPLEFKATIFFCVYENLFVTYFNAKERRKAYQMLESLIATVEQYKRLDFVKKDIYLNFDEYYDIYYEGLARCPDVIGQKKSIKHLQLLRKKGPTLSLYNTYQEYYNVIGDYRHAIIYADSIIYAIKDSSQVEVPTIILGAYKDQAGWYAKLKEYENAYKCFVKYDAIKDSLIDYNTRKTRQEMNVRYDVDQLKFEKIQLESRNRQIAIISLIVVLALALAWGISQRTNLKKLQQVQKKLIKSNEEVILQSQKAQESEKMKTIFINSMCHEIRTPLNAISGFSSLVLDESIDQDSKLEFQNLIQTSTNQLTRLINDLLEVANLDSSLEDLPVEKINLNDLLKEDMNKLITQEKKDGIDYRLKLETEECSIKTNPTYLSHVITNILNNANKFTDKGSIALAYNQDKEYRKVIITITDTGIGVPEDKHEWVFERFTKVDDFKPGTGLGLHLCRLIITRLQGSIKIDPHYHQGTRIIITLPADK